MFQIFFNVVEIQYQALTNKGSSNTNGENGSETKKSMPKKRDVF